MSRSRYESLDEGWCPKVKVVPIVCIGFSLRFSIVEERSYLQVPSVTGHVTMTSTLRVAFYGMYHELEIINGSKTPNKYIQEQLTRVSVGHLRHCFDYLRRALMCTADTNLEYVNPETDATIGWGYPRMYRDFESVKKFAGTWKNSSDAGIM